MRFNNTPYLRSLFAEANRPDLVVFDSFDLSKDAFWQAFNEVRRQHPESTVEQSISRGVFRVIVAQRKKGGPKPRIGKHFGICFWLIMAAIILAELLAGLKLHSEPMPQGMRNALRGFNLLPQQPTSLIFQFKQAGSTLATRPTGLIVFNCSTGMSCSWSANTFTLTATGGGGTGCVPPGVTGDILTDDGAGGCTTEIPKVPVPLGGTNKVSITAGTLLCGNGAGTPTEIAVGGLGQVLVSNGGSNCPGMVDPAVSGPVAHDGAGAAVNPLPEGCFANAAAPSDVSADVDIARAWCLRNGSRVFNLASGGALVTVGQKVMASSLPVAIASDQGAVPVSGTVTTAPPANASTNVVQFGGANVSTGTGAGGAGIPRVTLSNDSTLAANQSVNLSQINAVTPLMGNGATGTGSSRVTPANDSTAIANWGQGATGSAVPTGAQQIAGNGSGNLTSPLACDGYAFYDAATNGATQLVALTSNQTVYVCGYSFSSSSATANTLKLVYGTGSNCATGQTAMTPGVVLQAAASTGPIGKVIPVSGWARGLKTAVSNALCVLTNAAQTAQTEVWYTKF